MPNPNPTINIESIGFSGQKGRNFEYYISLRISGGGTSSQYTYKAKLRRSFFTRTFRLIYLYPVSISPEKFHEESHNLVTEAVDHLLSDLNNWQNKNKDN